jgi:hypothetical protein
MCSAHFQQPDVRSPHIVIRDLVTQASEQDDSLDVPGIVWFEHLNLVVGVEQVAEMFYFGLLGCTPDPNASFHANLGQQQFHLSVGKPQVLCGSIGLALPSLVTLRQRLAQYGPLLQKASEHFKVTDFGDSIVIIGPWGNTFAIFSIDEKVPTAGSGGETYMTRAHAQWDKNIAVRGKPGIRYLEFRVPNISAVAKFYSSNFGCSSFYSRDGKRVAISVGPSCHFVFSESIVSPEEVEAAAGLHVCVYIEHYKQAYHLLKQCGAIWTNPRFIDLDTCDTWQEAREGRQFRFKNVNGFELEHETRALRHNQFLKILKYDSL